VRVELDAVGDDHDHAAGCIAFVPKQPLPAAAVVEVKWTVPKGLLGKGETYPVSSFAVRQS
jgi:hypothetical protein